MNEVIGKRGQVLDRPTCPECGTCRCANCSAPSEDMGEGPGWWPCACGHNEPPVEYKQWEADVTAGSGRVARLPTRRQIQDPLVVPLPNYRDALSEAATPTARQFGNEREQGECDCESWCETCETCGCECGCGEY